MAAAGDEMVKSVTARVLHVVQGSLAVTQDAEVVYTALIGSCVVVCLHDPGLALGGMAHFVFPDGGGDARFGAVAIEGLLARLLAEGADLGRLQAKLYGGARVHDDWQDIGKMNLECAVRILAEAGVAIVAEDCGGDVVRRVRFCPSNGAATVVGQNCDVPQDSLTGLSGPG